MIRVVVYLIILAALAYGGMLLIQNPGHISVTWYGHVVNTSAVLGIAAIALAAVVLWIVVRFILGLPGFVAYTSKRRRREKGYEALSRGLIAVHSGDARAAGRASAQASRQLKGDALAIMLQAQAAHLAGNGRAAQMAFEELADRDDTRVLGLRGLYAEATRRGDEEAARHFAAAAHRASPLPWSAQAVLEHRATEQDWEKALATVESSVAARLIDKETGERQRAVLETALAQDKEMVAPDQALKLARSAIKRAPDLAPPVVVAARLLTRNGDIRKASRLIEKAWPRCQHPDIASAYLAVRPGDSTSDKLARAKMLMGLSAFDPIARMTVARTAIAAKQFDVARSAMEPLVGQGKRPTVKMCMLMSDLEESEHGRAGLSREWQSRAHHASLDPTWVADGIVYDQWAPISPTSGRLDAFNWQVPVERMGQVMDAMPSRAPEERALSSDGALQIDHHDDGAMIPPPAPPAAPVPEQPVVATQSKPETVPAAPVEAVQVEAETPSASLSAKPVEELPGEVGPVDSAAGEAEFAATKPPEHDATADAQPMTGTLLEAPAPAAGDGIHVEHAEGHAADKHDAAAEPISAPSTGSGTQEGRRGRIFTSG